MMGVGEELGPGGRGDGGAEVGLATTGDCE
jgi:hypothetical protein